MSSEQDERLRSPDGNHTSKGQKVVKEVDNVALAEATALQNVNPWTKHMFAVGLLVALITVKC